MSWTIPAHNLDGGPRRKSIDYADKEAASWQQLQGGGTSEDSIQAVWPLQHFPSDESVERPKKRLNSGTGSCSTLASHGSIQTSSHTDESAASHTSEPASVCQHEPGHQPAELDAVPAAVAVHETPVYHKNTRMPVDGWFQPCRYDRPECRADLS